MKRLAMQPPTSRFVASPRAYRRQPPAWEYPAGDEVRRVNPQGSVSTALGGSLCPRRWPGKTSPAASCKRRVLVTYRQMLVRELHLASGHSASRCGNRCNQ
mgnify:CR=1 FL=1